MAELSFPEFSHSGSARRNRQKILSIKFIANVYFMNLHIRKYRIVILDFDWEL